MPLTYSERVSLAKNELGKSIFKIISEKKTNLALAADVNSSSELLDLAKKLGDEIVILKTHIDIIKGFRPSLIKELEDLANDLNFRIHEDYKFSDIGKIVKRKYTAKPFRIADWAHIVTVHSVSGPGTIEGLYSVAREKIKMGKERGAVLLAQMTPRGALTDLPYVESTIRIGKGFPLFVIGFIGSGETNFDILRWKGFLEDYHITMATGISAASSLGEFGQMYTLPSEAIKKGTDCIIVGNAIYGSKHPLNAAKKYRKMGWEAYEERLRV